LNDIKEIEVDSSEDKPHLDVAMPYSSSGAQTTVGIILDPVKHYFSGAPVIRIERPDGGLGY
jgi:hypothetical protein